MSVAYLTHAASLIVAREDGILRRWRATPLPSWGYFAGRIAAAMLIADAVLAAWAAGGLLLSVRFFQWDPHRPRHARSATGES